MRYSRTRGRPFSVALLLCALAPAGCADMRVPRIDPTGESVFVQPVPGPCPAPVPVAAVSQAPPTRYRTEPGQPFADDDIDVQLTPHRTVAPVGSEVVLLGAVRNADGYLSTNRRLEWSITPGSVGHFVAVGEKGFTDWLVLDFTQPRKISGTYAIGTTSRRYVRLDRGTQTPADDVCVARGQGWVSVTSPVEGTSNVMLYSPDVVPWDCRTRAAIIHWIDAQFGFPPPAINPAGSRHVFTTTVLRQSNQCPHVGWIVRYEIVGGPPAGFSPDGAQAIEVPTGPTGQASAEIFQKQPAPGTNQVCIQVIRPDDVRSPAGQRFVVANGSTLKTWTAPGGLKAGDGATTMVTPPGIDVSIRGPDRVEVGTRFTFEVVITNRSSTLATGLSIKDRFDDGLEHEIVKRSSPAETSPRPERELVPSPIVRPLTDLGPGQFHRIGVTFRATRAGRLCNTVEVLGAQGVLGSAEGCVTVVDTGAAPPVVTPAPTPAQRSALSVTKTGPRQAAVGQDVDFVIELTNTTAQSVANVRVADRSDPSLSLTTATGSPTWEGSDLVWTINSMPAGQTAKIRVQARCLAAAAQAVNRVTVTAPGVAPVDAAANLEIREAGPGATPQRGLSVVIGESTNPVPAGNNVTYLVRITNNGTSPESQIGLTASVPLDVTFNPLGTGGPEPTTFTFSSLDRTLRFTPLPELGPGTSAVYRIRVKTRQPGQVRMSVRVTSRSQTEPIQADKTTDVIQPQG